MRGRRKEKKRGKGDAEGGLFEDHAEPRRITPVEIQQKEFRLAMRGYHERDVDEFLDEITEEVARL
jgi:DivIVA domain-containing protein